MLCASIFSIVKIWNVAEKTRKYVKSVRKRRFLRFVVENKWLFTCTDAKSSLQIHSAPCSQFVGEGCGRLWPGKLGSNRVRELRFFAGEGTPSVTRLVALQVFLPSKKECLEQEQNRNNVFPSCCTVTIHRCWLVG
jgi:hypothetical protein